MILKNCIFYLSDLADLPIVKTPNDLHSSVLLETDKHGDILMQIPATSEIDNFPFFPLERFIILCEYSVCFWSAD